MLAKHRPDITGSRADLLALKSNPQLSAEMADAYGNDNAAVLTKAGLPVTDGTKYLAHFAGPQGAVGILNADPSTPAASILGQAFAKANPTLAGYTAGNLASWADHKQGGGASPMSLAGPQPAASAPAPAPDTSQPAAPQAAPQAAPAPSAPSITPAQIAAIANVPALQNILPQRAPFSFARIS